MSLARLTPRTLIIIGFVLSYPLFSQEFNFERKIKPFPIFDHNGVPYELPFTGGMNRPVLQFVDIDGDSDPDLFVQEDEANRLILYRNIGTPRDYQLKWETDQFENLVIGAWFKFADVDNDGDFDLFAEKPAGVIQYFRNDGSNNSPYFILAVDTLKDNRGIPIFVQGFSVPEWADLDGDNDVDLFIGNIQNGSITYYRHIGFDANSLPLFEFVTSTFQGLRIITGGGADLISSSGLVNDSKLHGANSLTFIDIDNDRDNDLFWGDFFWGGLIYLPNIGTPQEPLIDTTAMVINYPPNDPLATGGFNVPRFADIDSDGDYDMFVGVLGGFLSTISNREQNLYFYENIGLPEQPNFVRRTRQFINSIDIGHNTIPALIDIDDDGDFDLFLTNEVDLNSPQHSNSRLYFFENQGSNTTPVFRLMNTHYLNYDRPTFDANYSPTFVDIDDDGDKDLFLGRWEGKLTFYRNDGNANSPNFVRIDENYAGIDVGMNSTPTFVDIDDDGDFDLFIGELSQNVAFGRINFYRNNGTSSNPLFELETTNYFDIDLGVGEFLFPSFADIDGDRDRELFIGTKTQGIVMYRNTGTSQLANFVRDPSFQLLPLQLRTSPNFVDIDNDGDLDLFSGSQGGGVIFYENLQILVSVNSDSPLNSGLPEGIRLLGNYPNPFSAGGNSNYAGNYGTTIKYELNLPAGFVGKFHTLTIFNLLGQKVREWKIPDSQSAKVGQISWNGRDEFNLPVPGGIYFYSLRIDSNTFITRKMLLIR